MAIAILSSCFLPAAGRAADDSARIRAIVDQAIRPVMAENDVPGMAVAVTVNGQPFVFNYGVASRENNTPVSDATLFELGSVSKTFAATLASYAQVLGKLSLDDHPGKYMPQLKGSAIDKATVLNLGTYTAGGLPLQFPDEVSDEQMASYFQHWKPKAAPGVQRTYSNPSLGLFGHLTSLALKTGFAEATETNILSPLGMKNTYVHVPQSAMVNYAWGYDKANKPGRMNPGVLADGTYGIRSTAADMIRYVQANIDPGKLEAPLRRAVEGTHVGYFKVGGMMQGLGWEQYPYPVALEQLQAGNSTTMAWEANPARKLTPPRVPSGAALFNKTGSTSRFGAYVAFVPEKKIGIVILANKNLPGPDRIKAAHAILEQLAP
jgi:beta-lactamase class C